MDLYPLKFKPIFKDKIWGGQKLKDLFGFDYHTLPNCGEAWVLSGVEGSQTEVSNGFLKGNELNELVEIYMGDLVGDTVFEKYGNEFPVLIKLIDANDWLSIQVHPNDDIAMKRHNTNGKTEMWYVLQADKEAQLISGFNREMNEELYLKHFNSKALPEILNYEKVKAGDVFYMPSGRIHALGPGVCLAEIQQTSDITYRIYDWDRTDLEGNSRELHTEQAIAAIDYGYQEKYKTEYFSKLNQSATLVSSDHFTTNHLEFDQPVTKDISGVDSFVVYLCIKGTVKIVCDEAVEEIKQGECVLIPAQFEEILLSPEGKSVLLETYIK